MLLLKSLLRPCTPCDSKGLDLADGAIEHVLAANTDAWMQIPGVVGTAIGLHEGKPCILIMTSIDPDKLEPQIPDSIEGYHVRIENTGEFRALGPD